MPQKFMLIAVIGYVAFASVAARLATSESHLTLRRRLVIMTLHWCGLLTFVIASMSHTLDLISIPALNNLWPVPAGLLAGFSVAVAASFAYGRREFLGWWSPLPWIRGVAVVTMVASLTGAAQGARSAWLPDWRFVGTSMVLGLSSLIVADMALMFSRSAQRPASSTRSVHELLRLCAVLPALLIYLIGIRL
ncbi:MAG: hypothetical protein AB8G18_15540 [Gammaproteobacteria bacterium]